MNSFLVKSFDQIYGSLILKNAQMHASGIAQNYINFCWYLYRKSYTHVYKNTICHLYFIET